MKKLLIGLVTVAFICSPAAAQTLVPQGGNVTYVRGIPLSVSDLQNSEVDIVPFGEQEKKTFSFMLSVRSKAAQSYEIGSENISATLSDGTSLRVIPANEMVAKVRKNAKWGTFLERLGAAGDAMRDDDTTSHTTGTVTSAYGTATYTSTTTMPNPGQAVSGAESRQLAEQNVKDIQRSADASVYDIQNNVLQRETVFPGQELQRKIIFERGKGKTGAKDLTVSITFAGEVHSFSYVLN